MEATGNARESVSKCKIMLLLHAGAQALQLALTVLLRGIWRRAMTCNSLEELHSSTKSMEIIRVHNWGLGASMCGWPNLQEATSKLQHIGMCWQNSRASDAHAAVTVGGNSGVVIR